MSLFLRAIGFGGQPAKTEPNTSVASVPNAESESKEKIVDIALARIETEPTEQPSPVTGRSLVGAQVQPLRLSHEDLPALEQNTPPPPAASQQSAVSNVETHAKQTNSYVPGFLRSAWNGVTDGATKLAVNAALSHAGLYSITTLATSFNYQAEAKKCKDELAEKTGTPDLGYLVEGLTGSLLDLALENLGIPKDNLRKAILQLYKEDKLTEEKKDNILKVLDDKSILGRNEFLQAISLDITVSIHSQLSQIIEDNEVKFAHKSGIFNFLHNNTQYSRELISIILLRVSTKLVAASYAQWKEGDQKQPFMTYLANSMLKRYNVFFEAKDGKEPRISAERRKEIEENPNHEERIAAWKKELAVPFLKEFMDEVIQDPIALVPLSALGRWGASKFVDVPALINQLIDSAAEAFAEGQDLLSNPEKNKESKEDTEYLQQMPGGQDLLNYIGTLVSELPGKVPGAVEEFVFPKVLPTVSAFVMSGFDSKNQVSNDEVSEGQLTTWIKDNVKAALANEDELKTVWKLVTKNLNNVFVHIAASILKTLPKDELIEAINKSEFLSGPEKNLCRNFIVGQTSISRDEFEQFVNKNLENKKEVIKGILDTFNTNANQRALDTLVGTFSKFFESRQEELLQFDEDISILPEEERARFIRDKYAPICKQFLETIGMDKHPLIEKYQIVETYLPVYLHAVFTTIQKPIAKRDRMIMDILRMTTKEFGELNKIEAFKQEAFNIVQASKDKPVDEIVKQIRAKGKELLGVKPSKVELRALVQQCLQEANISNEEKMKEVLAETTKGLTVQITSKISSNRTFIKDATDALANFIRKAIQDKFGEVDKLVDAVESYSVDKLKQPLTPEARTMLVDALTKFTKNPSGAALQIWKFVDTLINTAVLNAAKNALDAASQDPNHQSSGIAEVIMLLTDIFNKVGPAIEEQRLAEQKLFDANMKKIGSLPEDQRREAYHAEGQRHTKVIQGIYKPFVEEFFGPFIGPATRDQLMQVLPAELRPVVEPIFDIVVNEMVPEILAGMHENTLMLKDNKDELRKQVADSFKSQTPVVLARVGAEYAKAYIPFYLKKELNKLPSGEKERETLLAEKIVDSIADFFSTKGDKDARTQQITGFGAAQYIKENRVDLAKALADQMKQTGQLASLEGAMNLSVEYVEGLLLQVFLGINQEIQAKETMDPAIGARFLSEVIRGTRERFEKLNRTKRTSRTASVATASAEQAEKKPTARKLLDRLMKVAGLKREDIAMPNEVRDVLMDVIDESAVPTVVDTILNTFVNEDMLNKIIANTLEAYDDMSDATIRKQNELKSWYKTAKTEAMTSGKKIPPKPPKSPTKVEAEDWFAKATAHCQENGLPLPPNALEGSEAAKPRVSEVESKLATEFDGLLKELAVATESGLMKALTTPGIRKAVAAQIAAIAYDKVTDGKMTEYMAIGMGAAVRNLEIAEEVNGQLQTVDVDVIDGKIYKVTIDPITKERTPIGNPLEGPLKFNIHDTPAAVQQQMKDDMEKKVGKMIVKVGLRSFFDPLKNMARSLWFNLQDGLDRAFHTVKLGKAKVWLDKFCSKAFYYILGKWLVGLKELVRKGSQPLMEKIIMKRAKPALDKGKKIFKPDIIEDVAADLGNIFFGTKVPGRPEDERPPEEGRRQEVPVQ